MGKRKRNFGKKKNVYYQFGPERWRHLALDEVVPIKAAVKIVIADIFEIGWTRSQSRASVLLQQL